MEVLELHFSMPDARMGVNHRRRLHWTEINDLTDTWKQIHLQELQDQLPDPPPFYEYAHVQVEQIVPSYRSIVDNDNLAGKSKTVIDAMTLHGLWKDDNPKHMEISLRARVQPKCEPWLKVLVSEVPRPEPLPASLTGTSPKASPSSRVGSKKNSRRSSGGGSPRLGKGWVIKKPTRSSIDQRG